MDASNSQSLKHVKYIMDLEPFPDDVLLVILSFVPSLDLLKSCRLVSKRWLRLVDTPTLWKIKCQQKWRKEVFNSALSIPNVNWQRIFMKEPFLRNLIRNPCGTDGLKHWRCMHGGDGWKVEDNHFPLEVADSQTSFVTSFEWCKKNQLVDLIKEGLWEDLMDNHPPSICISDWYAGRRDCGCVYEIRVQLLSEDRKHVIDEFKASPDPIPQWNDGNYHQVFHVFNDYGPGVRFVRFSHKGKDTQFWKDWYGPRITNSSVIVTIKNHEEVCGSTPRLNKSEKYHLNPKKVKKSPNK
ncbi:F-box only protein 27 isoform X1 [Xenopus laevis]|uniref:F-box only protein 27 isoform X1 n=2 Tax=Xenopus laevis TaxID=8355 RepID=A0A1L8F411_XENLA|nr:F-box only protein 27 isoform X1 [Xenopus laevis]XP_018088850.1 F-box only protein 27 isoform X1 [Xenopus laevis]OCT66324.1 hypothetical protein XELAEV_18042580mg [Xenopus laevis]